MLTDLRWCFLWLSCAQRGRHPFIGGYLPSASPENGSNVSALSFVGCDKSALLLGLGCSKTSVCFMILSVQNLVVSALSRRFSKWASNSVFSACPNFSSVNWNRKHPVVVCTLSGRRRIRDFRVCHIGLTALTTVKDKKKYKQPKNNKDLVDCRTQ